MGGPESFWPNFSKGDTPLDSKGTTSNMASEVLDTFGIAHTGTAGDSLSYLDIKRMDADKAINLSLSAEAALGGGATMKEMSVNVDGLIEFSEVGAGSGLSGCEIYYQIQSSTYVEACKGVMVTGGKPLPTRRVAAFKDVWQSGLKETYNAFWVADNGLSIEFSKYATVVFEDPFLDSNYEDGIDNLYDLTSPWESILGYARYIDWPGSENSPETTVERANTAIIPILVSGSSGSVYDAELGTLEKRQPGIGEGTESIGEGIPINIPEKFAFTTVRGTSLNKLIGIHSVIIVGRKVNTLIGIPSGSSSAMGGGTDDVTVMASIDSNQDSMYTLKAGDHYVINYEGGNPSISFASNARANDPAAFGTGVTLLIDDDSAFLAGDTIVASVLPTGGTDGYLISQVIALVNVQTPCINIYDPRPGVAMQIAEGISYQLAPLIIEDKPAPIAVNGSLIDQAEGVLDHDPTTVQNLTDTPLEAAKDLMSGGGMTLTLSCLDENGCRALSSSLYSHLNSGNGTITTYICGPDSTPTLGGYGGDSSSIVNDIVYSYSDSNSYTISVTTGPKLLGNLSDVVGGATSLRTENVPSTGKVIQDMGDHVTFKVALDGCGLGPMVAINTAPKVIRVGDRVQCTVYNNAVEG